MFHAEHFIAQRMHAIDASGIRRVFDLAAKLPDPINLSIGQPDFDVPEPIKEAAIDAIRRGMNKYTVTQGVRQLQDKVAGLISSELPNWKHASQGGSFETLITSGVSGGLMLAILCTVGPGDEVLMPDPYFVMYKHLVTLAGGVPVGVDTYPDFQLTAARIERYLTPKTRLLLFNSPANPTGVVATEQVCRDVVALAQKHNFLLLSDEIYDEFWYDSPRIGPSGHSGADAKAAAKTAGASPHCPSLATYTDQLLLLRGFSKTYAMTGWRLGYAAGPKPIIDQMTKLQQYSFVCAPSMAQLGGVTALDVDMSEHVRQYRLKRDRVVAALKDHYELTTPGGAFYAFPKVPERLGLTATQFVEKAVARSLLIIPGSVFSQRDTHFRISYACDDKMLDRGLAILVDLARGK